MTCFLCGQNLDGWEEEDDPIQEHITHSPICAWAILMNVEQDHHDASSMEDPTHGPIADARRATFADAWPHDSKRGWTCKVDKMVEAGWHYVPTPESDDFVSCVYCKLGLDGWEPKDNPFEEHYRRSHDCLFFVFAGTTAPKTKSRKGRASKGGRQSTQSNARVVSQPQSIPDLDDSIDTSTISVISTMSTTAKSKGGRKTKRAAVEAAAEEQSTITLETDQSALQIPKPRTTRGKKRKSEQISEDDHDRRESTVKPEPPSKRRNTRTRNSIAVDVEASDVTQSGLIQPHRAPQPVRNPRKRGSSVSRRTSAAVEAAKKAGVDATIPDDADIEAALAAELERPLSDEEDNTKKPIQAKPKRGRAKKGDQPLIAPTVPKASHEELDATMTDAESEAKPKKRKITRNTKTAQRQELSRMSTESTATVDRRQEHQIESSVLTTHTVADDSGHETDASIAGKSVARKASKRKAAAKPRGKKAGTRVASRTLKAVENLQREPVVNEALAAATEPDPSLAEAAEALIEIDEKMNELRKEVDNEDAQAAQDDTKTAKGGKRKATKPKAMQKKTRVPQLSMPGAFSPLRLDSVEPSFASALETSTPPLKTKTAAPVNMEHHERASEAMEMRSPLQEQGTPTPRRQGPPPPLPPRSSARPTPVGAAPASHTRSAQRPGVTEKSAVPTPSKQVATTSPRTNRSPSAQSSDAENAPPSSLPKDKRPPLQAISPQISHPLSPLKKVQIQPPQPGTPTTSRAIATLLMSPSKIGGLKSDVPWSAADVELCFQAYSASASPEHGKENEAWRWLGAGADELGGLSSPEKKMSVEQWVKEGARQAEERLRIEGERVVGVFEGEGRRALRALEGIVCE